MRHALLVMIILPVLLDAQDAVPRRGDTIVVTGCIVRGTIESSDTKVKDGDEVFATFVTYRLTGDKKLVNGIKKEHHGHADVLTGKLKSDIWNEKKSSGRRIGNVTVGIGAPPQTNPAAPKAMPVLEVKELQHTEKTCGR